MNDPIPPDAPKRDEAKPAPEPYEPPTVQSVKLTDEAAESLT
jgi:hypothetical protein